MASLKGSYAASFPVEVDGGGGTRIGELATSLPEVDGGGGTRIGELATSLPEVDGGGGTRIGELATSLPEVDGGGGTRIGEEAEENAVPVTRTVERITVRTFSELIVIDVLLPW